MKLFILLMLVVLFTLLTLIYPEFKRRYKFEPSARKRRERRERRAKMHEKAMQNRKDVWREINENPESCDWDLLDKYLENK